MGQRAKDEREKNREKIITVLSKYDKRGLRWSELLKQSKLSRGTVNDILNDLLIKGNVKKYIDTKSSKYPPPVMYFLTEKYFDEEHHFFSNFANVFQNKIQLDFAKAKSTEEVLKIFELNVGILSSYKVIEALSAKSKDEANNWLSVLNDDLQLLLMIELSLRADTSKKLKLDDLDDKAKLAADFPKDQVAKIKDNLRKNHPLEIDYLDSIKTYSNAYSQIRAGLKNGEIPKEIGQFPYGEVVIAWAMWKRKELGDGQFGISTIERMRKKMENEKYSNSMEEKI